MEEDAGWGTWQLQGRCALLLEATDQNCFCHHHSAADWFRAQNLTPTQFQGPQEITEPSTLIF